MVKNAVLSDIIRDTENRYFLVFRNPDCPNEELDRVYVSAICSRVFNGGAELHHIALNYTAYKFLIGRSYQLIYDPATKKLLDILYLNGKEPEMSINPEDVREEQEDAREASSDEANSKSLYFSEHYLAPRIRAMFLAPPAPQAMMPGDRMCHDSINRFFEDQAQWIARNFGDRESMWKAIEHLLIARGYVYGCLAENDPTVSWAERIEDLQSTCDTQSRLIYALKDILDANGLGDKWVDLTYSDADEKEKEILKKTYAGGRILG